MSASELPAARSIVAKIAKQRPTTPGATRVRFDGKYAHFELKGRTEVVRVEGPKQVGNPVQHQAVLQRTLQEVAVRFEQLPGRITKILWNGKGYVVEIGGRRIVLPPFGQSRLETQAPARVASRPGASTRSRRHGRSSEAQ